MTWFITACIFVWAVVILGTIIQTIGSAADKYGCGAVLGVIFLIALFFVVVLVAHKYLLLYHFFG